MAFKVVLAIALVAVASAIPVEYQHEYEEHHAPAEYDFAYSVHDEHTGDIKSHKESRKGDQVQGQYELIDSDGYKRIVEYTADKHSGFNAVVHREPTDIKIPVPVHKEVHHVKAVVPVAKVVAPVVHYTAPLSHYATPVAAVHKVYTPVHKVITPVHHEYESGHVTFNTPTFNYHY